MSSFFWHIISFWDAAEDTGVHADVCVLHIHGRSPRRPPGPPLNPSPASKALLSTTFSVSAVFPLQSTALLLAGRTRYFTGRKMATQCVCQIQQQLLSSQVFTFPLEKRRGKSQLSYRGLHLLYIFWGEKSAKVSGRFLSCGTFRLDPRPKRHFLSVYFPHF